MSNDPTRNMVVFELGRERGSVAAEVPTRADDSIRQAWDAVHRPRGVRAGDVTALYSEWEPSAADARFLAETFPSAQVSYSFRRPGPDGWEDALAAARSIKEQAALEAEASADAGDADAERELLPLLWSASSPIIEMLDMLPHRRLVPGKLYLTAGLMGPTPHGTIGVDHLTHHMQQEIGVSAADLLDLALDNVRDGLRIEGQSSELGDLATMHRGGTPAAAAVALPDFHERLSAIIGDDRLLVGLVCHEHLLVTGASSGWAQHVEETVLNAEGPVDQLVPTLLLVERSGMRLLAERS